MLNLFQCNLTLMISGGYRPEIVRKLIFTPKRTNKLLVLYSVYHVCQWLCHQSSHDINQQGSSLNTSRLRQDGSHFPDDSFQCVFLNENVWILIKISLKFVPQSQINNIPALDQIMACSRQGNKLLSEPIMVILLTHICVTRPQWVKPFWGISCWV